MPDFNLTKFVGEYSLPKDLQLVLDEWLDYLVTRHLDTDKWLDHYVWLNLGDVVETIMDEYVFSLEKTLIEHWVGRELDDIEHKVVRSMFALRVLDMLRDGSHLPHG